MTLYSLFPIAPEIFLISSICILLVLDVFISDSQRIITYWASVIAVIITALLSLLTFNHDIIILFSGSVIVDPISSLLKTFSSLLIVICFIYSKEYLIKNNLFKGEFFILSLFTLLGIFVMTSSHNLLILYLGLETVSYTHLRAHET